MGDEALGPVAEAGGGHREGGLSDLADACAAARGVRMGKEGQDRAGAARLVAEIEVVGAGIVEVHGGLDEPEAKNVAVEGEVAGGVARDGG